MGAPCNKLFLPLAGRPLLAHTLEALEASPSIASIVVVVGSGEEDLCRRLVLEPSMFTKVQAVVPGGEERQDSVALGLEAAGDADVYLVHDGARPFVTPAIIDAAVAAAWGSGACVVAVPAKDTMKVVEGGFVQATPDRSTLWAAQTPQAFRAGVLRSALERASREGWRATDEAALVEAAGVPVQVVPGSWANIKVTTREDMYFAAGLLSGQGGAVAAVRVGFGFDVHALATGRRLVLGGVEIPWDKGLLGHSDADVAIHALMDALLGAAGLGDIGCHFPPTDERYRGISSMLLLDQVGAMVRNEGFQVSSADVTLVAEAPRLAPHIPAVRQSLAARLGLPPSRLNVKATTTEGLGFAGRGEGIAAYAVAVLEPGAPALPAEEASQ